jgi:hypothetical protein
METDGLPLMLEFWMFPKGILVLQQLGSTA